MVSMGQDPAQVVLPILLSNPRFEGPEVALRLDRDALSQMLRTDVEKLAASMQRLRNGVASR
jgi:hypothetical protein